MLQLVKEFDNYNLDILGVSEVRWTGTGKRRLASGHTILFSGRSDAQHSEGVALLLNKKTEKALLEWKPYGPRLLRARFHSKYTKLTVLACYAPTNDSEAEDKDAFYDQLQAASESVPAHDMLLIIGDLNARWEVTTPAGSMSWANMESEPSMTTERDWQTFVKKTTY
ncbi:hypothetical protein C0Q70_12526 [Pomacea canaliculata]|uniref:Endonuclease/exonuclease/phosphatase domain-containing protein n=1 Tax=Pomacea canaliculata TaxID=400727 RepID=A0A2T7P1S5_POMCA|nr:hypothetical protein C0Q70_12526 [Pomacea canaliculata]